MCLSNRFVWLLMLNLSPFCMLANVPYHIQFNTENGLPSSEVYNVALDSRGRPWFITDRGLSQYNGFEIKSYSAQDGLSHNTFLDYFPGPDGTIWFTGLDGSFTILDSNGLSDFKQNPKIRPHLDTAYLLEGLAWTDTGRIYFMFRYANTLIFLSYHSDYNEIRLEDIDELKERFEVRDVNGISWLDLGGSYLPLQSMKDYVALPSGVFYHNRGDIDGKLVKSVIDCPEENAEVDLQANIHGLYWDEGVGIWAMTSEGIFLFPEGDLNQQPRQYFAHTAMSGMVRDREGIYWISSLNKGVLQVPSFDFPQVQLPVPGKEFPKITCLLGLDQHLLIGTLDGELFALDNTQTPDRLALSFMMFGSMRSGHQQRNLIGMGGTLLRLDNGSLKMHEKQLYSQRPILELLSNGDIMQMPGGMGFSVVEAGKNTFYAKELPIRVKRVLETDNGIWVGALNGLWKIDDFDYSNPKRVFPEEELLSGRINDIKADENGGLWIATIGQGLVYIREGKLSSVQMSQNLNSNMVNRVFIEREGVLWAGTNQGLNRILYSWDGQLEILEIQSLNSIDGLPDNYINDLTFWQGEVWLATNNGLIHFDPRLIEQQKVPSVPIFLEEVRVNKKVRDFAAKPSFSFGENDVSFRFQGISMRKPAGKPFFRYRLQGNDSEWGYTNERTIRYLNLPPGSYRFEVAAQNRNGNWSPIPAQYAFVIRPHFSQTWWFRFLVLLLIVGIFWVVLSYRAHRIRQEKEHRLQLQDAQLTAQKAQLKAQEAEISVLRSQMNPHFVFNALNSIQNYIFDKNILKANHFLSCFAWLMRDGLDFSRRPCISLEEELSFLDTYLELESMRFPDRFTYRFRIAPDLDPKNLFIPPYLFQPLLENSVKHAFKEIAYPGELSIHIAALKPGWIRVKIRDNGPGFRPDKIPKKNAFHRSVGLKIVEDRIALLEDEYGQRATFQWVNLCSEIGQGMEARFEIPLQKQEIHESIHH